MTIGQLKLSLICFLLATCNAGGIPKLPSPVAPREVVAQDPAPSCTSTRKMPPPQAYQCNVKGTVKNPAYIQNYTNTNAAACANRCLANPACKSFSVGPANACSTYSRTVQASNFKKNPNSKRAFSSSFCYERTCVCPSGYQNCPSQGFCRQTSSDVANCGTCGNQCLNGQTCENAICTSPSAPDLFGLKVNGTGTSLDNSFVFTSSYSYLFVASQQNNPYYFAVNPTTKILSWYPNADGSGTPEAVSFLASRRVGGQAPLITVGTTTGYISVTCDVPVEGMALSCSATSESVVYNQLRITNQTYDPFYAYDVALSNGTPSPGINVYADSSLIVTGVPVTN